MGDGFSLAKLGPGWTSVTGRVFRVRGAVHAGSSGRWCWSGAGAFGCCWSCVSLPWLDSWPGLPELAARVQSPCQRSSLPCSLLLSSRARSKLPLLSQRRQLSRSHPTRTRTFVHLNVKHQKEDLSHPITLPSRFTSPTNHPIRRPANHHPPFQSTIHH